MFCAECNVAIRMKGRKICSACADKRRQKPRLRQLHNGSITEKQRKTKQRRKIRVMEGYGGRFCSWCSEQDIDVLTIDHINNDGADHRRNIGTGTNALYCWLIKNYFPKGFQVLCASCQLSKTKNGGKLPESRKKLSPDQWFDLAGCLGI